MVDSRRASGVGLERSCADPSGDYLRSTGPVHGVELLEARLRESAYRKHRHDTYAICLTTDGVLAFDYRGTAEISVPGQVVVLHPDELHDGHAGTDRALGYRQLYVEPALIGEAIRAVCGRAGALPFVRSPVITSPKLALAVERAFEGAREPLEIDSLVVQMAEGLLDADPSCWRVSQPRRLDTVAVERARLYLDSEKSRVVRSAELEAVTGLSRYELARQFRHAYGTSPHRYLLMRRLDDAREQLVRRRPPVEVALENGFADQAHFTRVFSAAVGFTPARYAQLRAGFRDAIRGASRAGQIPPESSNPRG